MFVLLCRCLGLRGNLLIGTLLQKVGSGEVVSTKAVGVACLNFRNKFLVLNNVFFIPGFRRNLIYVFMLHE